MVEIRLESAEGKSPRIRIVRMFLVDLCGVLGRVALAGGGGATTVFLCSDCKPPNIFLKIYFWWIFFPTSTICFLLDQIKTRAAQAGSQLARRVDR